MLSRRMGRRDHQVDVAVDGPSARAMIESTSYDLILLDLMMPGMSGLEVRRQIRERHSLAALPVVMVTVRDHSQDVVSAMDAGANDDVSKPIDFPVLIARVKALLDLREQAAQRGAEAMAQPHLQALREAAEALGKLVPTDERWRSLLDTIREQGEALTRALAHPA